MLSTLLTACGGEQEIPRRPITPLDHATTGTLRGEVRLDGPALAMKTLRLTSECAALHPGALEAGDALVHDGRVENAFVYVKDGLGERGFPLPTEPVVIDQKGCLYAPHVVGVQVGQTLAFRNSDQTLHNVHGVPARSPAWNYALAARAADRTVRFRAPEIMVPVRCDVHPWMQAFIGVLDHPYFAVTGPDGHYELPDLPPGEYTVAVWHERFGLQETHVPVEPKGVKEVSFTYASPSAQR